jgi:transcription elongation factor SPT6
MADLIDNAAELGSEDEEFDSDEEPRPRKTNGAPRHQATDSSEEESEDEEAERAVREGFIVEDEDEDMNDEDNEARRRERRKRRRERMEEEALDADDLEVIGISGAADDDGLGHVSIEQFQRNVQRY